MIATDRRSRFHRALDRILDSAWVEGEHKRGQPKNAGQFASGGSSAKAKPPAEHHEGEGEIFVSPNVKENLSFAEAKAGLASERQRQMHRMAVHLTHQFTKHASVENVIGDWSDGAENSMFVQTDIKDRSTLRYLAAKMGQAAEQKAVIPFLVSTSGKDSLWTIRMGSQDLEETRRKLDESGLAFRTLDTHGGWTYIHVFDPGSALRSNVTKAAGELGGEVTVAKGDGEFLGGETRDEGIKAYQQVIEDYRKAGGREGRNRANDQTGQYRPDFYGRAQESRKVRFHRALDRMLQARDEWVESEHKRGQPENAGQFASGGAGAKPAEKSLGARRRSAARRAHLKRKANREAAANKAMGAPSRPPEPGPAAPQKPKPASWRVRAAHKAWEGMRARREAALQGGAVAKHPMPQKGSPQRAAGASPKQAKRESDLASPKPVARNNLDKGGINKLKWLVTLENGKKAVFKGNRGEYRDKVNPVRPNITWGFQGPRENAAWQIAKLVDLDDLVPANVIRKIGDEEGVLIEFHEGKEAQEFPADQRYDGRRDLARAAAFDFIIGNEDRHTGNWMIGKKEDGSDQLVLIDHGLAFPDKGTFYPVANNNKLLKRMSDEIGGTPGPEIVEPYVKNKAAILSALRTARLPEGAVKGVAERIDALGSGKNWTRLYEGSYHAAGPMKAQPPAAVAAPKQPGTSTRAAMEHLRRALAKNNPAQVANR
jgi:hypothetical protein